MPAPSPPPLTLPFTTPFSPHCSDPRQLMQLMPGRAVEPSRKAVPERGSEVPQAVDAKKSGMDRVWKEGKQEGGSGAGL